MQFRDINMDKISIIVPVYNVEPYIIKCLDSITAQTHTNLEIVLINDGSPDNCGRICDEYASKDSRIKVNKIAEYIRRLQAYGTSIGKPTIDKIEGTDLWELRPLKDRIFFAYWKDNMFVFLHHFAKKTQKTPKYEIEQAERNLKDWKERFGE